MANKGKIENNNKRIRLANKYEKARKKLKMVIYDKDLPMEERLLASFMLGALPSNSSRTRIRNRCLKTGRPRGYYRKFKASRIVLRELALEGLLPGVKKSSW